MSREVITRRPMTPAMKREAAKLREALTPIAETAVRLDGVLRDPCAHGAAGKLTEVEGEGLVNLHCLHEGMTMCGKLPSEFGAVERWVDVRGWREAQHRPHTQPCLECLKWLMKLRPEGIDEPCPVCGRGGPESPTG